MRWACLRRTGTHAILEIAILAAEPDLTFSGLVSPHADAIAASRDPDLETSILVRPQQSILSEIM